MTQMYDAKWEPINKTTWRMAVLGGWLVLHTTSATYTTSGEGATIARAESMVFVPDWGHQWAVSVPGASKTMEDPE